MLHVRHARSSLALSASALPALACFLLLSPTRADAQVRRCVTPTGAAVYTDRSCRDVGGVEMQRTAPASSSSQRYRGCARSLPDLVFEMTTAFDLRDPNRLAGVYHWPGMSSRSGNGVLSRLAAMVDRPLVDIVPVMPGGGAGYYPQDSVGQTPVGLRVEQTLANGITPSRTVFGLTRHFGCWWIRG